MDRWLIMLPVFGHLALVQFLFFMVSVKRMQAAKRHSLDAEHFAYTGQEPDESRRWARNLDNQFQLPMLFYALVALLFATDLISTPQIWLAGVFLIGRLIHTVVQTQSDNVQLRGRVFTINYLALTAMWLLFFFDFYSAGA